MNIVKCINGHYYDADQFPACPHCRTLPPSDFYVNGGKRFGETVPLTMPRPWDDCRVKDCLGSGSTGTVYRLQRTIDYAVKVIPRQSERTAETARREYETAVKFKDCKHTIHYLDCRETESSILLIQDLSTPWMTHARQHACTVGEALYAVVQVCDALCAMETAGFLHMDVNPKNIFFFFFVVKLGDFSHARPLEPGTPYSHLVGTRPFMAPEIVQGGVCSGKEDIYSLGITMYLLLTGGRFPFGLGGKNPKVRQASDRIMTVYLDQDLKRIIEKAAAFAPEDRYTGAGAMANDIAAFMSSHLEFLMEPVPRPEGPDSGRSRPGNTDGSHDSDWEHVSTERTWGTVPPGGDYSVVSPMHREDYFRSEGTELPEDYRSTALVPGNSIPPWKEPWEEPLKEPSLQNPLPEQADSGRYTAHPAPRLDEVQFTAVAEASAEKEDFGVIEIAMYTADCRENVLEQVRREFSRATKEVSSHGIRVSEDAEITVRLSAKGAELEEEEVSHRWNGTYLIFSFDYFVPEDLRQKRILFRADIFVDGFAATTLRFTVDVSPSGTAAVPEITREDIRAAFLSYAREDLPAVTYILQALRKARPDMDIFFDLEKLRSGEHWEDRLYDEIRKRDRLYLCWSHYAALSEWVKKEWQCMAAVKGIEAIEPIPLEDPEDCPAPEQLQSLHFNDIETLIRKAWKQ